MLQDIFYISGIAVNIGVIFTIYKVNKIYFILNEEKSLIKSGEEGNPQNLHSSQSVGNFQQKEEIVKERLRKIEDNNIVFIRRWINYFASKNE